jgi:glycosyltransferase involved in cell wall biosynthesis
MAMNRPVIASKGGGVTEQIEDGVTGLLVDSGDAEQLATALARLQDDPELRARLAENGRKKFLEKYEFEGFYSKLRALQSALLAA